MRLVALGLAVVLLSPLLHLPLESVKTAAASAQGEPMTTDTEDSERFFQAALRTRGPERDNLPKIEALIKRMTLEEKVGQMTQLTINMVTSGRDQSIQIDPAKLAKAVVRYGVGPFSMSTIKRSNSSTLQ